MNVLDLYRESGALLEGHFLLASGRHSPKFLQSTTVLQYPRHAHALGGAIAELYRDEARQGIDFVLGPAMGGVVLAHAVGYALGVRAFFAEKDGHGGMGIRSAFRVRPGERFLAVEDVVTTGGSLRKAVSAAEEHGAVCVGVGCIIDRTQRPLEGATFRSLTRLEFPTFDAKSCPLCDDGVPLEEV